MAGMGSGADTLGTSLLKFDLETGQSWTHDLGKGRQAGEPVLAASPGAGTAEDDGWIMAYVYDSDKDSSDVVILNAQDFDGEPAATIHLPRRVPFGFHGNWIADS